jgi:hypothetical protein
VPRSNNGFFLQIRASGKSGKLEGKANKKCDKRKIKIEGEKC